MGGLFPREDRGIGNVMTRNRGLDAKFSTAAFEQVTGFSIVGTRRASQGYKDDRRCPHVRPSATMALLCHSQTYMP